MGFDLTNMGRTDGFTLGSGGSSYGFDTSELTADRGESIYSLGYPAQTFAIDNSESAKIDQFYPSPSAGGKPTTWENIATYGLTRAIDAAFFKYPQSGGNQSATFAGANGQTVQQGAPPPKPPPPKNNDLLLMVGLGALAIFAMDGGS